MFSTKPFGAAAYEIPFAVPAKPTKLPPAEGSGSGQVGGLFHMRKCVASLVSYERVELPWPVAVEARCYMERLVQETLIAEAEAGGHEQLLNSINPDAPVERTTCQGILELTKFWLRDYRLIEKLFKVLVPRFREYDGAYTSLHKLRKPQSNQPEFRCHSVFGVLELNGNPWPPIGQPGLPTRKPNSDELVYEPFKDKYLINVLLDAARKKLTKAE